MIPGFTTICPEEIRAANRKAKNSRIRSTARYRAEVKRLTWGKSCIWCGRQDRLTIHHPEDTMYASEELYISSLVRGWVMCNICHLMARKNLVLCPVCRRGYMAPGKDHCKKCETTEEREEREIRKYKRNNVRRRLTSDSYRKAKKARKIHKGELG